MIKNIYDYYLQKKKLINIIISFTITVKACLR